MSELLFHETSQRREGEVIRPHAHDFWQLDLVLAGAFETSVDRLSWVCDTGDAMFIPPGSRHGLTCRTPSGESIILKFRTEAAEDAPRHLRRSRTTTLVGELLRDLTAPAPLGTDRARAELQIAHLIDLLWAEAYGGGGGKATKRRQGVVDRIDHYLARRQGGYVSVAELANHLGCSASHAARRFRDERGMALKAYLDGRRVGVCRDLLLYSELTVAEIADQLEFPDLSSFSRFVRRHLKVSPRTLRAEGPSEEPASRPRR